MINVIGLGMAAPTILHHGTEEQKRRFLPPLLSADEIWCQGFSEPGAGSDLANVQASAVRDGDNWIINGHKVWTSLAHFASWMIMMCAPLATATSTTASPTSSCRSPTRKGVTVRPLIKITGETGFNEVLFEDVVVPDTLRVDEVGKGWTVAMTTLLARARRGRGRRQRRRRRRSRTRSRRWSRWPSARRATASRRGTTPSSATSVVQLAVRAEGIRQTSRRTRVAALTEHPMRLPLQAKVLMSELMQDIGGARRSRSRARCATLYLGDPRAPDGGHWPLAYMNSYGITIAAGTNEIQRNILGERVLGLAEVEVDGGRPMAQPRRISASAPTSSWCATRRASSCATTSAIERLRTLVAARPSRAPTRAPCSRAPWDEALWQQMVELGWTGARGARGRRRRRHEDDRRRGARRGGRPRRRCPRR